MGYDISFKVKVDGTDTYVPVGACNANITWNVGEIIRRSTGLEWKNEANNGLCKDVVPFIAKGIEELLRNGEKYKQYEPKNGWGSVAGVIEFFTDIITDWNEFVAEHEGLKDVATFWID